MKKILLCMMLLTIPFSGLMNLSQTVSAAEYEKWGQLAVQKTKEKYPNAQIKDYKHVGRVQGINTTLEKFKLWLKEGEREFGVLVHIEFDKQTERVIDISFKEVEK